MSHMRETKENGDFRRIDLIFCNGAERVKEVF